MGTNVKSANSGSIWYVKVEPPVTRGLEGWFTLDTDASRFWFNRAPDKPDALIVGAPTAFAGWGRFKGTTNYLQTQVADTDEVTLIVVGKSAQPLVSGVDGTFLVGCHLGPVSTPGFTGNASGANIYLDHPTLMKGSASRDNGSGASTPANLSGTGTPTNSWALRTLRAKTGAATIMTDHTAGLTLTGADVSKRVLTSNRYRIGSATAGFAGESDISFVAIHSAYLTDVEVAAQIAVVRKRMARLGISV
jgi:hypothetical protein